MTKPKAEKIAEAIEDMIYYRNNDEYLEAKKDLISLLTDEVEPKADEKIKKLLGWQWSYDTKNSELLADFTKYCKSHPRERFWQALKNWSGAYEIIYVDGGFSGDTYEWETKDGK